MPKGLRGASTGKLAPRITFALCTEFLRIESHNMSYALLNKMKPILLLKCIVNHFLRYNLNDPLFYIYNLQLIYL